MYACSNAGLYSGSPGTCAAHQRCCFWGRNQSTHTLPGTLTRAVSITRRSSSPPICGRRLRRQRMRHSCAELRAAHLCPKPRLPHRVLKLGTRSQDLGSLHTHHLLRRPLISLVGVALHPRIRVELCEVDLGGAMSDRAGCATAQVDAPAPVQLRRCAAQPLPPSLCPLMTDHAETRPGGCERRQARARAEQCTVAQLRTFISKLSTLWRLMTASFSAC